MDDNTPQVKTAKSETNRRLSIFLAAMLVAGIIVAVALVLFLPSKANKLGDSETAGVASNNTRTSATPDKSQEQEPGSSTHFLNRTTMPTASSSTTQVSSVNPRVNATQSTKLPDKRRTKASNIDMTESVLANWYTTTNASYSYKLHKKVRSYAKAEEVCQSINSELASTGVRNGNAKSEIVNIIFDIQKTVKGVKPYVWIGMHINSTNSTDWIWSDGYVQTEDSIESWGADQPDRIKRGVPEKCVAISTKVDTVKNETGLLHDCPCQKKLPFICEKRNIPEN